MKAKIILYFSIVFMVMAIFCSINLEDDYTIVKSTQIIESNMTLTKLSNQTMYFNEEDIEFMNRMYITFNSEWVLCFDINTLVLANSSMVNVAEPTKTTLINSNTHSAEYECESVYNFAIHSHPSGSCDFSPTDYKLFHDDVHYHGVFCGENQLNLLFDKKKVTVIIR